MIVPAALSSWSKKTLADCRSLGPVGPLALPGSNPPRPRPPWKGSTCVRMAVDGFDVAVDGFDVAVDGFDVSESARESSAEILSVPPPSLQPRGEAAARPRGAGRRRAAAAGGSPSPAPPGAPDRPPSPRTACAVTPPLGAIAPG